ncbi:MAG: tetratricopeptide repeat protein [Thermodesulfobacteriota bacterium]
MNLKGMAAALAAAFLIAGCASVDVAPDASSALTPNERLRLGAIYESKGEEDLALKEYKALSREDAFNSDAYFALANLYLKREDYGEAEANYKKAIEINPGEGTYHNNLGWLYMERGEFEAAAGEVKTALARDPSRRYVYLDTLGVIQTRSRDYAGAEASLTEAAGLVPPDQTGGLVQIYTHLLELYGRTGESSKAGEVERKLRELAGPGQEGADE